MTLTQSIHRLGLLKTFSLLSFLSIVTISILSGFLYFSLLRNHLLNHEISISSEFIQTLTLNHNREMFFNGGEDLYAVHEVEEFLEHIISMPDILRVIAYNAQLKILWSNDESLVGKTVESTELMQRTLQGEMLFDEIDHKQINLPETENTSNEVDRLVVSYIPMLDHKSGSIIGLLQVYKQPTALYASIGEAGFLVVIVSLITALILHGSLYWIVNTAHSLIEVQRRRIRQATNRTVELNEQSMRRIGSELHDGSAQSLGFALLMIDVLDQNDAHQDPDKKATLIEKIRSALKDALDDIRNLSSGLVIPELSDMNFQEALQKVIDRHKFRTGSEVETNLQELPDSLRTSIKICIYRLVQEALNNAYRHAECKGQKVDIQVEENQVLVSVSDAGPGMSDSDLLKINSTEHLGLRGLRERVESLGGVFSINNKIKESGLVIRALIPLKD